MKFSLQNTLHQASLGVMPEIPGVINENKKSNIRVNYFGRERREKKIKENMKLKRALSSVLSAKSEKDIAVCLKEGCTNTDTIFQTDAQEVHEGRRDDMSNRSASHHTGNMDS